MLPLQGVVCSISPNGCCLLGVSPTRVGVGNPALEKEIPPGEWLHFVYWFSQPRASASNTVAAVRSVALCVLSLSLSHLSRVRLSLFPVRIQQRRRSRGFPEKWCTLRVWKIRQRSFAAVRCGPHRLPPSSGRFESSGEADPEPPESRQSSLGSSVLFLGPQLRSQRFSAAQFDYGGIGVPRSEDRPRV